MKGKSEVKNKRSEVFFSSIHIYFFIFSLLLVNFSFAQSTLYGKITDKNGKPISDVRIAVSHSKITTNSNEKGEYELSIPSDTNLIIEFSHVSFGIRLQSVHLAAGKKEKLDISVETTQSLDTVVIEDKSARTNFIQTIPTKDIYVQSGASGDFNVILFTQLGVQQSNELSSGYSVRGGNYDENLVYVNDVEVYRPFLSQSGQQEGLSFVNSDMVSAINFSSGGFEARYGDKMSSVLDIRYKKPREFAATVSGGLLNNAIHVEDASKDKRFTYNIGAREKSDSYLLKSMDTKGTYKPLFLDLQSSITYDITDEWEIDFLANISRNKYNLIPQSRKSAFGTVNQALQLDIAFDGQELDSYQTYMGAFSTIYRPHGRYLTMKFITSAYNTQENETYDILGQYYLNELETDFGNSNFGQSSYNIGTGASLTHARDYLNATVYNFEQKGNKNWGNARQLWWGVKYQHEIIHDQLSEWTMTDSSGYSLPHVIDSVGSVNPQPYQNLALNNAINSANDLSSNRFSGYVQHAWNWESKDTNEFSFTVGARGNYWDMNKQFLFSPRTSLSFKPKWKHDVLFKASAGYYYQPPFFWEMIDFNGVLHPDVKAQKSIHYVLGYDINFRAWNRPFKFITEAYYKQLYNLNPYEINNVSIRYAAENTGTGYAGGIDMKLNGELVKGVDSWLSMSIMKTMYNISNDAYNLYLNSDHDTIIPGYTANNKIVDTIRVKPGNIPRPTDQRVTFSLFFQDYLPNLPRCKMHMNILFGTGLPFGPPGILYENIFRMPPYRRVDIGFSYEIVKEKTKDIVRIKSLKSLWFSLEVYNLLAVNNVVSYYWVRDASGRQYAVPNYLSPRLLNARIVMRF